MVQIIDSMKIRQDFKRDYFIDNSYEDLPFVGSCELGEEKEVIQSLNYILQLIV